MSTYTQELAKRIREQNEIRDIYKERAQEAQTSYDTAVNTLKSGGDVYSLDDSARAMYRNIQSELAKQQRKEQERLKKEREQMSGIERFGHTLGDFFGQGVGGMGKFLENTVDYFGTMFGADEDWIKRDWTQELFMDKLREGTKGSFLNDGKFGNMVQSSMFGLGNMLPSLALNAVPYVGGALSTASFMVNAAGGSTENALQNGATRDKALLYGTLSGISEGAIEKISGGIGGVGKGIVQSVGKSAGKSAVAQGVLGTAKKYTGRMIGEGLEEVASDVIDPLLKATYTGKVDYSDISAGSLAETFGVGAMTSGLMLGGQAMAHNATAANRVRTKLGELNEVKATLDKRYYDGKLTEAQYKQGLSDINWLAEKTIKTMNRVSDRKAEKIVGKVGEKRLENAGIVQNDGKFNVNQPNVGTYNYKAMTPSLANKVDSLAYKPTSAELTAEQESLVKDYGKINNGKASIVFTDDIWAVTEDGSKVSANGAYSDGVIYISRTAENPLREVMKHEFTHALEGTKAYGKFARFVIDQIQKSPVLQKEYGDFAKTFIETAEQYKGVTADDGAVVSEIVAKYSERLFSDPKAINRLARANKGLAMKVLGMVTDRLSAIGKGKGTAEMRKFLRRAENLYRKAITAKPSRVIAINGNTANEKDTTADTTENSNIVDKKPTIPYAIKNVDKSKINFDENEKIVKEMKPVTSIKSNVFQKGNIKLTDMVAQYFDSLGNNVFNAELGDVELNKRGVKDSMAHGIGALKASAFKAVPQVIKNGKILDYQENWKNRGEDTVVLSAPILIDGIQHYMGVILLRDNSHDLQRFYIHEISLNKKEVNPFKTVAATEQTNSLHGGLTSINSISNSKTNVNNSATESLKNNENVAIIDENSNITDGKESTSKQFDLKESIKNLNSYSELERNRILANKNNLIAEDYQSIIDFITESKNDLKNKFLYIGKINSDIVLKIKDETGINVNDYSYVLNSEDIRHIFKNHSDNNKESERGQLAVTNSNVLDIIDTMLMPDGIRKEYNEKSGVVSIVFEKVINERLMAITVLSNDKKRLTLKSARIMKKRRIVSPSVQFTSSDKTSTSKTLRSLNSSNNSISNSETNVNNSATDSLKNNEKNASVDENSNILRNKQSNIKFSLAEDSNGDKYVKIDTEQNIFDGIAYENLGKVAKIYLREHFRGVEIDSIKINNTSVDEYTMSKNTQRLYSSEREAYTTKMKAATELDNFIKAGIYNRREVAKHPKTFNKDGYDIYDINFEIDDKKFSGEMLIAINGDKKLFYDITKIKKKMSPAIQVFPKGGGASSSNNSISNSETNVNNSATDSLKNDEKNANIDANSNIADGKPKIQYAIKNVDRSKINFEANENTVRGMKPVTSIKSNVFQKGNTKLTNMVAQYFDSLGNNVYNAELGDVELNKRGIKDSKAHGLGTLKAAAYKAVPQVIKNGKIVDYQENWKNRGKDTVVLSAPILINEIQHYMGVILLRELNSGMQRFYLHEISLNKKEVNPFKTTTAVGQASSKRSGLTSNNSISNSETNVNNSATESLRNQENSTNIDENSNNDIKYSLKDNKTQKKAYTHKDADAMVRGVIKLISDNETVKIRNVKEISDEFYRNINSGMDEGAAAVIVSERIVDEAYTEHYDPTSVERAGDVIEFYNKHIAKRFNLDSINAELKEIFGGSVATIKRVAHNADGLDVAKISDMATAIRELGIDIDSKATPAEIFTAIYNEYRDAKEIEKGYKQSVKDSKTAKERNALVQKLAKAMLFAFDKYGSETKLYKRVKELSDTVESLKNYNRTERAKEKHRANIVNEVRLFKEMAKRGISAHIVKDSVTDTLIKAISRIVSRKDINAANLATTTEVLRNFYTEERIGMDYQADVRHIIEMLSAELAEIDKRSKDLTAYQLDLADKMIKNTRHYIRTAENITRDGKNESARELGQKGDDEIRQDEELRNKYKVKNVFIKLFRALRGIVDPKCVIGMAEGGRKDGVIGMLYDDIKKAETNQLAMQIEFMEPMDNFFKENKGYAKRLSRSYTIGKTEITFDDAIAILLVSKRAHASATIDGVDYGGVHYKGGGFSYELDNGKTVYIDVSRSDIERIEKSLSELDLEYIDILEEFYNKKARKAKKETDRIIIGSTTVVDGEYYYPISRADEMIAKKFGDSRDLINNVQNYENLSFNKHLVKNARNPIKLRGSLEVFTEYAKLMSAYATMTQALKNFSKVMSINLNAGIPGARIKTLRSTLKETAPFMEKYMDELLQDIQGTGRQKTSKLLSKMRDGYIKAVLGANVKTWFSQWAGVPAAMTYLSPRDMAKGFAMHVTKEEFMEHSKFGKAHIYNKSAVRSEGIEQKIGSVGDFFMRPIGFSDKWMHIGYWQSCRYAVQRMYGHELGTEANYRMADELYEKVARETQSTNVMSERSAMQRSESEIMRTLTTFASDAQKQLSRIVEGSVSYIYAQMRYKEGLITKQELRASRNQLVRSASSFALSNAVYVAIGLLFNALLLKRDEEGKKWDADDYGKAFGMGMLESYAGLFPIFRDMFNKVASGYDIEHFSYSMINDLVDSTVGVYKLVENRIKGEEVTRMDALKTLRQSLYSVNAFLGMPTKNVAKYAKMIAGLINDGALYKYNSLFYPAKKSELNAAIEEKKDRLSESIFGVMLTERGFGDMSETAQKKLLELYKAVYKDGINVIPSNVPNKVTWKDSNGTEQEKDLKAADKAVYRANNAKAAKDVEKLLKSGEFSSLSKKEQADAVKKVYAYYNALSKAKVTENKEINTQMLLVSLLSVEDMAILSVKNASLVADKYANGKTIPESKKRKLLKLLNTFGLTFAEKELVRVILGYSPSNPKTIKQTIRHSSLNSEEKAYLLGKVV